MAAADNMCIAHLFVYPAGASPQHGLSSNKMPLSSRIVVKCDTEHQMALTTSDRVSLDRVKGTLHWSGLHGLVTADESG